MDKAQLRNKDIILDYNRIYSGPGIRTNSRYYKWLTGLLNPRSGSMLLDVSCGEGLFLREAVRKEKSLKTFGLDISDIAISIAKINSPASILSVADGQRIPFQDKIFDYVTCLGSLEHYLDTDLGLRELNRVAKDEARFCIVLPNSLSIDLFFHVAKEGNKPEDDFQIIEKTATRKEWEALLNKNGFLVEVAYSSNLWPELFKEGTFKIKSISKYIKRSLIKRFAPLNLAREFVFICTKKKS